MWPAIILVAVGATLVYEVFIKKHGPDFVVQLEAGKMKEIGGIKAGQVILVRGPINPDGTPAPWTRPTIDFAPSGTEYIEQAAPGDLQHKLHEFQFKYMKGDGIMEVGSNSGMVMSQNDIAVVEIQIGTPVTLKKPGVNVPPAKKIIPPKKK